MPNYICTNYGSCPAAGKVIELPPGAELVCPEDGFQLQEVEESRSWLAMLTQRSMLTSFAGIAAVAMGVGAWYVSTGSRKSVPEARPVAAMANSSSSPRAVGVTPDEKALAAQKQEADKKILDGATAIAASAQKVVIANEYVKAAIPLMQAGKWEDADKQLLKAKAENPDEPLIYYNQSIVLLKQGRERDALSVLEQALQKGFKDLKALEGDADLKPLTGKPEYAAMVGKYKAK